MSKGQGLPAGEDGADEGCVKEFCTNGLCTTEMRLKIVEASAEHDFVFRGSSECPVHQSAYKISFTQPSSAPSSPVGSPCPLFMPHPRTAISRPQSVRFSYLPLLNLHLLQQILRQFQRNIPALQRRRIGRRYRRRPF